MLRLEEKEEKEEKKIKEIKELVKTIHFKVYHETRLVAERGSKKKTSKNSSRIDG